MAKTYLSIIKYEIKASYEVEGIVEKPDIVGAIFGQCEGLIGEDMDLKELQQSGKIGRIEITVNKGKGKTTGEIIIPSSLDKVKTSILAAAIETVDKVGPFNAKVKVLSITDTRKEKLSQVTSRAQELLKNMLKFEGVESEKIAEEIKASIRTEKITEYQGLPAGPEVETSDTIIVVEGRADVLKLLSYGIKNVIAMNGANITQALIDLCKKKGTVILLIDGDRGGELNAKKLSSVTKVDYIARAPDGKEVEELTQKEILQALKRREPIAEFEANQKENKQNYSKIFSERNFSFEPKNKRFNAYPRFDSRSRFNLKRGRFNTKFDRTAFRRQVFVPKNRFEELQMNEMLQATRPIEEISESKKIIQEQKQETTQSQQTQNQLQEVNKIVEETMPKEIEKLRKIFEKNKGSLKAMFLDSKGKKIKEVQVKEILEELPKTKRKIETIIFDGIVTKRLIEAAEAKQVKNIIGVRKVNADSEKVKVYVM